MEHRKELSFLLCQAAEIEHLAMCQYLYTAFSLRDETGPGLTAEQLGAVRRWRRALSAIASEEMLHWALVNNILTAIGSAPFVSRPNFPHRAKGYPPTVQFALLPFGEKALRHFAFFERPLESHFEGVPELIGEGRGQPAMDPRELQPRSQDYVSQGELYRALDDGLVHLAKTLGEDGLFIGPPWAQAGPETFGWSELVRVVDLESARTALVRIIEQGEGGSSRDSATSHYGRFLSVLGELRAMKEADPDFEPSHPVVAAVVRGVEGEEPPGPLITDPATAAVSDLFNVVNDLVLQILSRYFAFGHESGSQQAVLANVGVELMIGAIAPLGGLLARLPVGPEHPQSTAGASFQLAYRSNFLLPHRRVAWIRFAERLRQAADFATRCTGDLTEDPVLRSVAGLLVRGAARLEQEIEPLDEATGAEPTPAAGERAIEVTPQGPYRVMGRVPLRRMTDVRSAAGEPLTWQLTEELETADVVLLCRCGGSATKPYCDGTHKVREWDGTECAPVNRFRDRASVDSGPGIVIRNDGGLCSHAGFCANRVENIYGMLGRLEPDDGATRSLMMAMIERCPSGALTFALDEEGPDIEPPLPEAIGVVADGPLYVTGGVPVNRADGQPLEGRNRQVLCRCGLSATKPLCDGAHKDVAFRG